VFTDTPRELARGTNMSNPDNSILIEAWNTILFEKFCRFRFALTQGLADHSDALLHQRPYPAGARVLDVGCGFGDTTRVIADQVGANGAVMGVDCAPNFIEAAVRETADAGVKNTSFFVADVQTDALRGPYDAAFSRFRHHVLQPAGRSVTKCQTSAEAGRRANHDRLAQAGR
jgi:2-polyprenyl-3-methyl-5-hydroxy-6-metoxy-1,4-benzoquinol methylase